MQTDLKPGMGQKQAEAYIAATANRERHEEAAPPPYEATSGPRLPVSSQGSSGPGPSAPAYVASPRGDSQSPSHPTLNAATQQPQTAQTRSTTRQHMLVPQISNNAGAPFLRAYSSLIRDHDIPEAEFIAFIDGLNVALLSSSALGALETTGTFIHKIPLPIISLVGRGISAAGRSGNASASKASVEAYVAKSNEDIFERRGLQLSVPTGRALKEKLQLGAICAAQDVELPAGRQMSVWQRRISGLKDRVVDIRETTLEMQKQSVAEKLRASQAIEQMEQEDSHLMSDRRKLLKSPRQGRRVQDSEEAAAEGMLWIVIQSIS